MKYRFRIKDILNNYRHCVIIPAKDYDGKEVKQKEKILLKIRKGDYKFIFV